MELDIPLPSFDPWVKWDSSKIILYAARASSPVSVQKRIKILVYYTIFWMNRQPILQYAWKNFWHVLKHLDVIEKLLFR